MSHSNQTSIWTRPFFMALVNNFFIFLVFYSLLTVLPLYVIDELHGTEGEAGLATTIFLLSAIIIRPFSGKIIELLGKKKTLIISVMFFGISSFIYFWVNDFYLLMGLRFFHGIWFSIGTTVLVAIAADMIPPHRKGEGLGYFAMSMNLAVVVGPFISLALIQWVAYSTLFMGLSFVIVIGFLCSFGIQVSEDDGVEAKTPGRLTFKDLIEVKAIPISLVGFLTSFAYSGIMSFISVYAKSVGIFESVSLFFVVFAAAMLLSRPYTGRLYDRSGPNAVIYPSLIIFAIGLILLSIAQSVLLLMIAGTLIGLGYGALLPSFQTMSIQAAPKRRTGHATATFFIFYDLGIAVGSFVLGVVSSQFGFSALYIICSGMIFVTIVVYKVVTNRGNHNKNQKAGVLEL
ncbi:MFS transporter [Rossellomorea yichunensis]|jgi:predicted MFS family arabinose efflux permease|uniref:MFS transporter n=1 Tax=Rossellomorea yichunensis TaxID=3077331 RepID=UPI0028DDCE5D|nr:MFS transporter [Rossellomorea sp. YC4-1]MDT9026297.1 MFS transporter [Rossellomorea sp. YC4-1]